MTYGGVAYGGEPDCTARNIVIGVIVLYLLYVYVFLPSQNNGDGYGDGSTYDRDYFTNSHYPYPIEPPFGYDIGRSKEYSYPIERPIEYDISSRPRVKRPRIKRPVTLDFLSNLASEIET